MSGLDDFLGPVGSTSKSTGVEEYPIDGMCQSYEDGELCFFPLETLLLDRKHKKAYVVCVKDHVQDMPWEMFVDG